MGKRYYCDYCDKSFADNPVNRKLHLSGSIHIRNKKAHYDAAKDERELLEDDHRKNPCRTFMTSGDCRFGERCQYSHMTDKDRTRLSNKIAKKQKAAEDREKSMRQSLTNLSSSLESWLDKRSQRLKKTEGEESAEREEETVIRMIPDYQLPDCLKPLGSLPLSVIPPTKEDILNAEYSDWG